MSYEVKTPIFEGPLDLLLQLITSHQVEITDLSLTDLVSEYVAFVDTMAQMDLEATSEFLLIAATLIQLKARSLLPDDAEIDLDEELALAYERDLLLSRLLASLTYKDVAAVFAHRMEAADRYLGRSVGLDRDIRPAPPELVLHATADDLAALMTRIAARPRDVGLDHLEFDLPSVDDAITDLRERIAAEMKSDFESLTAHLDRPVHVVAYFLALLELARWGLVGVNQEHREAAIQVDYRPEAADQAFASEWA
ncbi:MAG: segregation/condensation protein A [Acidimicrobiia bacterium]|nr:segregation/condensation protein A [Acidimicrobiia bacterium]